MIKTVILIVILLGLVKSIPKEEQLCLANSLIVGRDDMSDLRDWECKVCDQSNRPVSAHFVQNTTLDVKCIVSVYDDFIMLAFRYTSTVVNVWEDILYPLQVKQQAACETCKVHSVFIKMWTTIRNEVLIDLQAMKQFTNINKLHVTGISLGGGLATIAFIDIAQYSTFDSVKVTTFGAPRVGNKAWANYFDLSTAGKARRYVVDGDPIAALPTCLTFLCSYRQTGIKIVCYEDLNKCYQEQQDPDSGLSKLEMMTNTLKKGGKFLRRRYQQNVNGIVDHIDGYPKIYNSTLIMRN